MSEISDIRNDWRLTDEEITRTVMLALAEAARRADLANADEHRAVADAQVRKLAEWGDERCDNADHWPGYAMLGYGSPIRFECAECQEQLREDVVLP